MQVKKKKRFFTLMIIPHTEESVISLRIPLILFQISSVFFILCLLFFFFWVKSYHRLKDDLSQAAFLKEQNRNLMEQVDRLAQETEKLKVQMEGLEALSKEIGALIDFKPSQELAAAVEETVPLMLAYEGKGSNIRMLPARGENGAVNRAAENILYLEGSIPKINMALLQLKEGVEDYKEKLAHTPSIWPARGRVTSEFGPRRSPFTGKREFHTGIDIAGPKGTPILSAADGEVIFASYRLGFGNTVIISHGYGFSTLYAHLRKFTVNIGDKVQKGEVIGYMGSTGRSTGTHLHYEVHYRGVAVDPRQYLP